MARAAKLPIIIHCRPSDNSENAWDDLLRLIREHWSSSGLGGVLHCFTGTVEHAGRRSIRVCRFVCRQRSPIPRRRTCVTPPPSFRWSACSSRPTRPIWRRFPTAANATSRAWWIAGTLRGDLLAHCRADYPRRCKLGLDNLAVQLFGLPSNPARGRLGQPPSFEGCHYERPGLAQESAFDDTQKADRSPAKAGS